MALQQTQKAMTYQETCEYLYNQMPMFERQGASGYKEGLSNTQTLDAHFGHPHQAFATIHVAGTNGKGSVSHSLAAILQESGLRVGLYTSPHLVDFRERIRINGEPISEQYVIDFVEQERAFFEPLHPSFFEVTTALAFKYFRDQQVDIAVVEVGLGGRLDCTNIITPLVSIITNISFDHTQFLGDTLAKIAGEKAGIIKPHVPVIIGEANEETRPVFENKAQQEQAPIVFAQDVPEVISATPTADGGMDYQTRHYGALHGDLGGSYQERNLNTILHAIDTLCNDSSFTERFSRHLSQDTIARALSQVAATTGLMGRWQRVKEQPRVICDTGHNVGGWQYLSQQLKALPCGRLHVVFGMVNDKDIDGVLELLPTNATYYFTKADTHRAIPESALQSKAATHGLQGNTYPTVREAYQAALQHADQDDVIFVGGSSYVVGNFLRDCQ
jgi:dihydrofolate synthase/folylpolyglutamate synthase